MMIDDIDFDVKESLALRCREGVKVATAVMSMTQTTSTWSLRRLCCRREEMAAA